MPHPAWLLLVMVSADIEDRPVPPDEVVDETTDPTPEQTASARYQSCLAVVDEEPAGEERPASGKEAEGVPADPFDVCLRSLIADHPDTKAAERAEAVLDTVRVVERRLARRRPWTEPLDDGGLSLLGGAEFLDLGPLFGRLIATAGWSIYGLLGGLGTGIFLALLVPPVGSGLALAALAGGLVALTSSIGLGVGAFLLGDPDILGPPGSFLSVAGIALGGSWGLALLAALNDPLLFGSPYSNPAGIAAMVSLGLAGGILGGVTAYVLKLTAQEVNQINSLGTLGVLLGGLAAGLVASMAVGDGSFSLMAGAAAYVGVTASSVVAGYGVAKTLRFRISDGVIALACSLVAAAVTGVTLALAYLPLGLGGSPPWMNGAYFTLPTAGAAVGTYVGALATIGMVREYVWGETLFRSDTFDALGIESLRAAPTALIDSRGGAVPAALVGFSF